MFKKMKLIVYVWGMIQVGNQNNVFLMRNKINRFLKVFIFNQPVPMKITYSSFYKLSRVILFTKICYVTVHYAIQDSSHNELLKLLSG